MIFAQGWKDNKVHVIVISRCMNGMDGWTAYLGVYDPNAGGTYETATWTCKGSSANLTSLMYYDIFSEMAAWVGGDKPLRGVQEVMLAIHDQMKQIAGYVEQAYKQGAIATQEPQVYQKVMQ